MAYMAYTKQTWAGGDTVTAAKLNHMEDGIDGAFRPDLVLKMDSNVPHSGAHVTFMSGLSAADLYDKMVVDEEPVLVLVHGYYKNAGSVICGSSPFFCTAVITSVEDLVQIWNVSEWGSGVYLEYTASGIAVVYV